MSITVSSDTNFKDLINNQGYDGSQLLYIKNGATLTCTETPTVLIANTIRVLDGTLFIDGTNISSDNVINFVGNGGLSSGNKYIDVRGYGTLKVRGAWFDIGTTDGTQDQVIDLSTSTGCGYWTHNGSDFCVDVIPMIQVETGKKITFKNASGTTPEVGDWIELVGDNTQTGKIKEVGSNYVIVWLFSGSLSDGDNIRVVKLVDNVGEELQVTWQAQCDGAPVKADGVYMEFGNARSDGADERQQFGTGYGGLVFHHAFKSTDLTLGGSAGGYVPDAGCNIRVPNVILNTSNTDDGNGGNPYANGEAFGCDNTTSETNWYRIEMGYAGEIDLNTCNAGNATLADSNASAYRAEYVGAVCNLGSNICGTRSYFNHCLVCQSTELKAVPNVLWFGNVQDIVLGADILFCTSIMPRLGAPYIGGATSFGVTVSDCISVYGNADTDVSELAPVLFKGVKESTLNNTLCIGADNSKIYSTIKIHSSTNVTIKNLRISSTYDYTQQTVGKNLIYLWGSSDIYLSGIHILGGGNADKSLIYGTDETNLKVRAIGMYNEKLDMQSATEAAVKITGLGSNVDISRVWTTGGSDKEVVSTNTTAKDVVVQNCSGNYDSLLYPRGGDNVRFKGVHGGSGNPGSSSGWAHSFKATYSNNFDDGFHSDTTGSIICMFIAPGESNVEANIISGNPKFLKDGSMNMADGDVIEFDMAYFAKGHTGFTGETTFTRSSANWGDDEFGSSITKEFQYQISGEDWNGTWLDLTNASNLTNISGNIASGVRFKIKLSCTGTAVTGMNNVTISSTTTLQAQHDNQYPIDQVVATLTITNLIPGSIVEIYDNEIAGDENRNTRLAYTNNSSSTFTYIHNGATNDVIISVIKQGYVEIGLPYTITANNQTVRINQQKDIND